jgi:adenylylsulfate kinase-like enzyme
MISNKAIVLWFTGLSDSGKTTISIALKEGLEDTGKTVIILCDAVVRKLFHRMNSSQQLKPIWTESTLRMFGSVSENQMLKIECVRP